MEYFQPYSKDVTSSTYIHTHRSTFIYTFIYIRELDQHDQYGNRPINMDSLPVNLGRYSKKSLPTGSSTTREVVDVKPSYKLRHSSG